jgi:alpha-glucosidase (family GH31 glycosyl hydrolase)
MWTGDNKVDYNDIYSYLSMALSLGVSGMAFHGADLPGFDLAPTDENFI